MPSTQHTRPSFLSILLILTLALELVSHSNGRSIGVAPRTNDVVGVASHARRHKPTRRDAFIKFSNDKNNEGEDHSNLKAPSGSSIKSISVSKSTGSTANDDDKDNDDKDEADIDVFWGDPKTNQKEQATKAFIIIHGRLRDGATYWQTMSDVLQSAVDAGYPGADSKAFIIAPQFFSEVYNKGQYSSSTLAFADTNAWVAGDIATHPRGTHLTSFDALDSIIRIFSNRTEYPSLRNVTLVGHGGGGQMVARYAMVGNADEVVNELVDFEDGERGIHVRYIIGDPSSQAYFTGDRPVGMEVMGMSKVNASSSSSSSSSSSTYGSSGVDSNWQGGDPSCEWWNTWRYGFDGFNYTTYSSSSPTDPNADPNADPNSLSTNLAIDSDNSSGSSKSSSNSSLINTPSPNTNSYISSLSLSTTSSYPLTPIDIFARYVSRDIILILGLDDTKPNGDQYCPALLQGGTGRVYRNLAWWSYVNTLARTKEPVQMLMEWVNGRYASGGSGGAGKKRGKKDEEEEKDEDDEDDNEIEKDHKHNSDHSKLKKKKNHHRQHDDDDDDEDSGSSSSSSSTYTLSFSSLPNWSNVTYKSGIATRLIIVEDAGHDAVDVLSGKEGRSALFLSGVPLSAGANDNGDGEDADGTENGEILIGWRPDGWNGTESDCSMCDPSSKENLGKDGNVPDSSNPGSGGNSSSSHTDGNSNGALGGALRSFGVGLTGVWTTTLAMALALVTSV